MQMKWIEVKDMKHKTHVGCAGITILSLGLLPKLAGAAALTACLGTGIPDLADGQYDCSMTDVQSGSGEVGQHLYLDWHDNRGDEIRSISLDLAASRNTSLKYRGWFAADHLDGAQIVSENSVGDRHDVYFRNFTDAVDNFYIGFNLDRRASGTGAPVSPDYDGARLTVTTSQGRRFSCAFKHVDLLTADTNRSFFGRGLRVRTLWRLPCQPVLALKHDLELINQLDFNTLLTETRFCKENPDSPFCD